MKKQVQVGIDRPRTPEMFRVMDAIQKSQDETGYTPLYREISARAEMSIPSVCRRIKELSKDGWIGLIPNRRRAIVVLRRLPEQRRRRA